MSQINNISKIPFKVSARTARLIGRENIATSRGAIIELVKNGYDADGKASLIYFDNEFSSVHNKITAIYFNRLLEKIQQHYFHLIKKVLKDEEKIKVEEEKLDLINLLSESYIKNKDNTYVLNLKIADESYNKLKNYLSKLACLYIVDNGEGMTADVIINHWMVIGTDNKHDNFITKSGRVKTGAKGIGRFALDKLGSVCEMITIYNPDSYLENQSFEADGYIWRVNWEDFEGGFKTIDKVGAELEELKEIELEQFIEQLIPSKIRSKLEKGVVFKYGTILKISNLREVWNEYYIDQVYSDLEILVPPEETGGFQIYLFSSNEPDRYGLIPSVVCDDFDYKIIARANEQQEVEIKIIRSEYDVDKIPIDFFQRKRMLKYPYRVEDFRKKEWALKMTFAQLIPGYKELDTDLIFETIGKFEFVFYYLKRSKSPESQKFFHKNNLFNFRKGWLDKFGGIKIFRDNFRVRPYGEAKNDAFDWLGLGIRKAKSPAGVSKKGGGYRVEPENIAGIINISRVANINFEDKSSREGLQENKAFVIFKQLITSIINIFEEDRSYIAQEMDAYYKEKNHDKWTREQAENIVKRVYEDAKKSSKEGEFSSVEELQDQQEKFILAQLSQQQTVEIERLQEEMQLLRGMASSGIVLASFTHDLSKLSNALGSRVERIKSLFSEKAGEISYKHTEERKNPYYWLEQMKENDIKIKNWLRFSLGAARKDKRKRKHLSLKNYFNNLKNDWLILFQERKIEMDLIINEEIGFKVFEIDLDSIFNNLIANSVEAFNLSDRSNKRQIKIQIQQNQSEVEITYSDTGPGISGDIKNPEKIFEPLFTTKRHPASGEEIGTGLGMWIIKSVVEENNGTCCLNYPEQGFALALTFPSKNKSE